MTIALKGTITISGWNNTSDDGFTLNNIVYTREEAIKLRDYLNKVYPVDTAE